MENISMEEIFENVRKEMKKRIKENKIEQLKADSIEKKVIKKNLLEPLGYIDWEERRLGEEKYHEQMKTDRNSIVFYNERGDELLVCFVTYQKITEEVEKDVCRMLNDEKIEWGILTDGSVLEVFNKRIQSREGISDNKIFQFNFLEKEYWKKLLQFISYENIFKTENIQYFYRIAEFKAKGILNTERSFRTYVVFLNNFFEYFSKRRPYCRKGLDPLEEITDVDFKNFISQKQEKNGELLKQNSLNNMYSQLAGFLKGLNINNKYFMRNRKLKIDEIPFAIGSRDTSYFTKENVGIVLEKMDSNKKNRNRNLVIFYLLLYMGIEKSNLLELKWGQVHLEVKEKRGTITLLNGQLVEIPAKLVILLQGLKKEREDVKDSDYVITTYRNGNYSAMNAGTINGMFIKLKNYEKEYEVFSPQYIRSSLPGVLLDAGFSIEEICSLMNIKISNILNYLPEKKILEKGKDKLDQRLKNGSMLNHPLVEVMDQYIAQEEKR